MNNDEIVQMFLLDDDSEELELLELIEVFLLAKRRKTCEKILNRDQEGAYNVLIEKYLITDEDRFVRYFRISITLYNEILNRIRNDITTQPCNRIPNPISAEQKLCITLRYFFN